MALIGLRVPYIATAAAFVLVLLVVLRFREPAQHHDRPSRHREERSDVAISFRLSCC
mgnify:CR=1 FL=1